MFFKTWKSRFLMTVDFIQNFNMGKQPNQKVAIKILSKYKLKKRFSLYQSSKLVVIAIGR